MKNHGVVSSLYEISLKGIHFKVQNVFIKIKKPYMCWSWLQDSQRLKASITIEDEYLSTKDTNKLRATFKMLWFSNLLSEFITLQVDMMIKLSSYAAVSLKRWRHILLASGLSL